MIWRGVVISAPAENADSPSASTHMNANLVPEKNNTIPSKRFVCRPGTPFHMVSYNRALRVGRLRALPRSMFASNLFLRPSSTPMSALDGVPPGVCGLRKAITHTPFCSRHTSLTDSDVTCRHSKMQQRSTRDATRRDPPLRSAVKHAE